jgi:hypothetical protein
VPPFVLEVTFRQGTSYRADTAAMIRCADHSPEVTGMGPAGLDPNHTGAIIGIVRRKELGRAKTAPTIKCLTASPLVLNAVYPN